MWKCKNCGTEFEGLFCPECGTKREENRACPQCGAVFPAHAKFCPECGAKIDEDNKNAAHRQVQKTVIRENSLAFFTEARRRKVYHALAIVPAAMCALFSFLLFMFCLAPSAEMLDILMGGTTSVGNIYDLNDASSQTIVAFAAIGLVLAGVALLFLFLPKLKWREVPFRHIPVWGALYALTFAVYFAPFVAACVICTDIKKADDGLGLLKIGAGPILIIVFSLLFLLMLGGIGCARYLIGRKNPSFAAEEKESRAALAKQQAIPVPDEKTQFLMRLRTAMRKKTFLRWSIPFAIISSIILVILVALGGTYSDSASYGLINGMMLDVDNQWGNITALFWIVSLVVALGIGGFCFGILRSKKVRIPSLDLQTTMKKSQKWFGGACIAYTIVGIIELVLVVVAWLTAFKGGIDRLSLEESWLRGFFLFVTAIILAVILLDIVLSFSGWRNLKQIENFMRTRERAEEIDLHTINAVPEERRARVLRRGFPAAILAGFMLMTILVVSGVGYSNFSTYKLDKIDIGDPYTTVTRTIGEPDEGGDGMVWKYYSKEYLSLTRRSKELEEQLLNAETEEEFLDITNQIAEVAQKLEDVEYRCIIVTFTMDGEVESVTMYRIHQGEQEVEYEKPSQQNEQ